MLDVIYPSGEWDAVDPVRNVKAGFPPTYIVHGEEDEMVPLALSRSLYDVLVEHGVECGIKEIPGEGHTFAAKIEVGSQTWHLQREGFDFLESFIK